MTPKFPSRTFVAAIFFGAIIGLLFGHHETLQWSRDGIGDWITRHPGDALIWMLLGAALSASIIEIAGRFIR